MRPTATGQRWADMDDDEPPPPPREPGLSKHGIRVTVPLKTVPPSLPKDDELRRVL